MIRIQQSVILLSLTVHLHSWCMGKHSQIFKQSLSRKKKMLQNNSSSSTSHKDKYLNVTGNVRKNYIMFLLDFFQVVSSVLICHVGGTDVKLEVWAKVLKVVIVWKF